MINNNFIPRLIEDNDRDENLKYIINIDDYDEYISYLKNNYEVHKLLDIFDQPLSHNSSLELHMNIEHDFLRLKNEEKYLAFLDNLFKENGDYSHVFNIDIDFSDIELCALKLERVDCLDRFLLLKLYETYNSDLTSFQIKDKLLNRFFLKGILRETYSSTLYFQNLGILIRHGFDLSIPIHFKDTESYRKYEKIVTDYKLFFRDEYEISAL